MTRIEALIHQGARCGHIDGKSRIGVYIPGEEYDLNYDAALNARPAGSPEDELQSFATGYAAGYYLGADDLELDDEVINAPLPEECV